MLGQWEQRATHPGAGFELSEPVSWLEGVVLRQLQPLQASPALTTTLLHYTVQARCNNRPLVRPRAHPRVGLQGNIS